MLMVRNTTLIIILIFLDHQISCRLYVREGIIRDCILEGSDSLVPVADKSYRLQAYAGGYL